MSNDPKRPQRIPKRRLQRGEARAPSSAESIPSEPLEAGPTAVRSIQAGGRTRTGQSVARAVARTKPKQALVAEAPKLQTNGPPTEETLMARLRRWMKTAPALSFSLVLHLIAFVALGAATFATFQPKEELTITASAVEVSEAPMEELAEIDMGELEEFEEEPTFETDMPEMSDVVVEDVAIDAPVSEAVPDVAGTAPPVGNAAAAAAQALASAGSPSRKKSKASASFYGSPAQGNRFVFIVDNSKSMVNGKMLTTIDQLLRTINSLTPKQEFYVLFYSDQAYLMFHPNSESSWVKATQSSKSDVLQWVKKVQLCQGGRLDLALIKAFELEPDTVFLVGDGTDVGQQERKVLLDQLKIRRYPINTLCIGGDGEAAKKLEGIASLTGGAFQFVQPSPEFVEMAKTMKFKMNPKGKSW